MLFDVLEEEQIEGFSGNQAKKNKLPKQKEDSQENL